MMAHPRPMVLVSLLVVGGAALSASLAGCTSAHLIVPAAGAGLGLGLDYACSMIPAGPRVTFINDSSVPMRLRYWVGRRDTTAPGGVADIRTGEDMAFTASPGEFFITQCGRSWWVTSMTDAIIRVRIDLLPDDGAHQPIWLQLDQPQPYKWRAVGESAEALAFERFGGGGLSPLPRDMWIDGNNGPFPVDKDLAVR